MSMSVSVESVPMLDHRIGSSGHRACASEGRECNPRASLRRGAGSIPEMIRKRRDKRPFPVPFDFWARGLLNDVSRSPTFAAVSRSGSPRPGSAAPLGSNQSGDLVRAEHRAWYLFIDRDPAWTEQAGAPGCSRHWGPRRS
jgi:hypothetical protein